MQQENYREIPYNYTSADDRQLVCQLMGPEVWQQLETLRDRRVTGRSARLLMRFFGEVLIHRRNPFLYQELVGSRPRRRQLFNKLAQNLDVIESHGQAEPIVLDVLRQCRERLATLRDEITAAPELRRQLKHRLGQIVGETNVRFDPFTLVAHATDATDWRLHLPLCVVTPSEYNRVAPLLTAIAELGLHAIPRGAGTGLTGGALPLRPRCVVINTEKLNHIEGITQRSFALDDGSSATASVLSLQAGVITEHAMEYASKQGLVFATDPTSAWASTIGGNIAENAGGKTCVLWGTCIDNVLSFELATVSGQVWTIRRVNHQLRKIHPDDRVRFEVRAADDTWVKQVVLGGNEIRKPGLWKDITNKALGGLPGLQKEGTDGVITSAEFVLYPAYPHKRTLCLEFFGKDMDEASRVILELSHAFPNRGEEALMALEHFDAEYVQAIDYEVKAPRAETPKAVLLIDVVGHTTEQVERGLQRIRQLLVAHPNSYATFAHDAAEAARFWADRRKLGAIARRTNAFKLNEDIVLPLDKLAEFATFIDTLNTEEARHSQRVFLGRAQDYLLTLSAGPDAGWLAEKLEQAIGACKQAAQQLEGTGSTVVDQLSTHLHQLFRGHAEVGPTLDRLHKQQQERRIVVATHMHAGDGNVHVNIPVLSNLRPMMERAEQTVDRVMAKVVELGGVVSGEHGIGVTKLKYLDQQRVDELDAYRRQIDPDGVLNPGKLSDRAALDLIFTPSFNLMELEARILQHGQLEALSKAIAHCVRCGRCKPSCCVFHPAGDLFAHPRNKNLAIGALIEALLYDAQQARSPDFALLGWMDEIADHCTICHKCLKPCPVDIDTGEVSVLEREILTHRGFHHVPKMTALTLKYLQCQKPGANRLYRSLMVNLGGALQRAAHSATNPWQSVRESSRSRSMQLLRSRVPAADHGTLHDVLASCGPDQVLVLEPTDAVLNVFYFPGCGSERLRSQVGMATLYVLARLGARVVLPPPFLCCGFPLRANARKEDQRRIELRNSILFDQIASMFGHLSFAACIVSCGTCREALQQQGLATAFGARLTDIARFAADHRETLLPINIGNGHVLYHAPCHDSLDGEGPQVLQQLGVHVTPVDHCCSEAGTLALSRPDITHAMLQKKAEALREASEACPSATTVLTNCPSCLQGLGRQTSPIQPRHIAVELAHRMGGGQWIEQLRQLAKSATTFYF